ncbi:molybdopterin-dependent oxidoreductase [Candidatus Uabimicrobium sp. HlEnr_7]|uniref:molybdopterin-dependent oxidoreductase n=1 Tax=Candidatus Uabimicrobium helgolandensis TaxID=3095367 RepID=UPI0035582A23
MNRRDFLKKMAFTSAAVAAVSLFPGVLFADEQHDQDNELTWKKSPCRFCGVGCGLLIGTLQGKAVAVKGDPESPVNKGLCCVKGYHSVQALYGEDRLQKAMVRKNGTLVEVPIDEALDLVATKLGETIAKSGKNSVSIYGSGQWAIPDGYVASKLFKGCIGTNNVEANARLCMSSAVTGFISTFGLDEPMGCYEDIDHADTFVLWGNNMAEMHPVLFSRILDRRQKNPDVKIIDLATRMTRTSSMANHTFLFYPNTDIAIANAICYEIIRTNSFDKNFIEDHIAFKKGKVNIGYGLEDHFSFSDEAKAVNFNDYKKFLEDYTPEKVEKITGVKAADIRYLASLYSGKKRNVVSFWCMGVNQHTRGTWMNNVIYNIHLLVGKISQPGNGPFSLTGQPSACGTVREVGTLTHKLPHGVVTNKKDRKLAAKIWQVPVENIPDKPTYHTVEMFRALDRGDIKFMWIQVTNPMVTMPNLKRYRDAAKKEDRFIVVSDVYPTPTTDIADVILPSAMWIEREGMFGNSERRTQHWDQLLSPPGEAISDGWQIIEVAQRLGYKQQFYYKKEKYIEQIWKEYTQFHDDPKHRMASYEQLKKFPGVMWPYVEGKETTWRYNSKYDPAASPQKKFDFYGKPDHRAWIWLRPYESPPESPNNEYPLWLCTGRVIEHWHSGSMTRRIPVLHRAVPEAYMEMHPQDAKSRGIRNGETVQVKSRRGSIKIKVVLNGRGAPVEGQVFVPFFDENLLINELTIDAFCPISKQPDYKKCAVQVERV